ncbi:MAG TPA: glycosyltransferase family 4 protein [Gammaproteobacteria bacterium]|jgi:glycosyltransferase involved in cell wall biosynthesis|nr:glycosyltransferase family 4 protein [Gammaproteobacteria bacterium]
MSKQTVLVLASTFPRWKRDSEPRFIYDLCNHINERFELIVLAPHCRGAASEEQFGRLRVKRFRYAPEQFEKLAYEGGIAAKLGRYPWYWLLVPWFFLGQLIATIKIIKSYDVTVIHAHWLIPQGLIAVLAKKLSRSSLPILCTSHGGDLYGFQDQLSLYLKTFVLKHCEQLTVVSKPMVDVVRRLDSNVAIKIMPMGVDLQSKFTPSHSIRPHPEEILFVGRLVEKKGLKLLLAAMPQVLEAYPDTRLRIIGDGPLRDQLTSQVDALGLRSEVSFLGRCIHSELVTHLHSAAMVVLPFSVAVGGDMEGLGLTIVEAMGCETPVIIGDVPAIHDVVQHGQHGVIVNPESKEALANAVIALRDSPQKARKMARSGRQRALQIYDWQVVGERYSELLTDISGH